MKKIVKKAWNDPVWSRVIAHGIIVLLGFVIFALWTALKSLILGINFKSAFVAVLEVIASFLKTEVSFNYFGIVLIILGYSLGVFIVNKIIKRIKSKSVTSYNNMNFHGANIKWKWEKVDGEWKIKYDEYEKSCPRCRHDLEFEDNQGNKYLNCMNGVCNFRSSAYHYEAPSNVVVLMDLETHYFHTALESAVNSELRRRGLK